MEKKYRDILKKDISEAHKEKEYYNKEINKLENNEDFRDQTYAKKRIEIYKEIMDLYDREINAADNALDEDDYDVYREEKIKLIKLHAEKNELRIELLGKEFKKDDDMGD